MSRILVFGMTENPGGVESFLLNYYRHIDRDRIQFDFLCNSHDQVAYEEDLIALGARVFHIAARSRDRGRYHKELEAVFREHASEWDVIWVNVSSLANIDYLKMAKKYGIAKRVIHSHNSQNMDSALRGVLHKWNRRRIGTYATDFWACSYDAARWFYQDDLLDKTVIIKNAIDVRKLAFDENKRRDIRSSLGIADEYVIGNVGRLHFQKNQMFLLEVFRCFLQLCPNARLVLVGQGEDERKLRQKCEDLRITEQVIFAGVQTNIDAWLSSFDLFLFPSVFEGLGIAALEAEANGLPVLASDEVIPEEVRLNDNFKFFSLKETAAKWAEEAARMKETSKRLTADEVMADFVREGYEIGTEAKRLERLLVE